MAPASMLTSRCCNGSALPVTVGAVRYPGIKLHDPPRHHACSKSSCTVAATSVAGQPGKSIKPSSPPSSSPTDATASTQLRYDHRKTQRPWPAAARWIPLRLPPFYWQRRPGRATISSSSTNGLCGPLANSRFRTPPCPPSPATRQVGDRISPRRQSHPTDRRSTCRLTFAATARLLNSFCQRLAQVESNAR